MWGEDEFFSRNRIDEALYGRIELVNDDGSIEFKMAVRPLPPGGDRPVVDPITFRCARTIVGAFYVLGKDRLPIQLSSGPFPRHVAIGDTLTTEFDPAWCGR